MIIFVENGKLGNQLFQYHGLKHYFPNQKLVFLGCDEIFLTFEDIDAWHIDRATLRKWLKISLLQRVLFWLADIRLIGIIIELDQENKYSTVKRRGILPRLYLFRGYFQHKDPISCIDQIPRIKPDIQEAAKAWLVAKGGYQEQKQLIFLHVRRGDYLFWPSRAHPAVLDLKWYKTAILKMSKKVKSPLFVVMSDDYYYVQDVFEGSESLIISDNSQEVDFAIMSLCTHGILSASSFAWWGGYLAKNNGSVDDNQYFFAPKYWAGQRKGEWFPNYFISDWMIYI